MGAVRKRDCGRGVETFGLGVHTTEKKRGKREEMKCHTWAGKAGIRVTKGQPCGNKSSSPDQISIRLGLFNSGT